MLRWLLEETVRRQWSHWLIMPDRIHICPSAYLVPVSSGVQLSSRSVAWILHHHLSFSSSSTLALLLMMPVCRRVLLSKLPGKTLSSLRSSPWILRRRRSDFLISLLSLSLQTGETFIFGLWPELRTDNQQYVGFVSHVGRAQFGSHLAAAAAAVDLSDVRKWVFF